ncbi:MAG: FKBP-type peptidyl-prolyl cis-trans isomerase [Deltaproteobacteria bacterium]|nr:FKBP-type peptidyl-prolyl cis-trans isomerase [Deltaproteobacteria bacterium]
MKYAVYVIFGIMLVAGPAVAADQTTELKSETDKLSYALGLDLGAYFKSLGEDFNLSVIQRGIDDSYNGKKALMTTEEAAQVQQQFAARQQEKQVKQVMQMTAANQEAAKKFLDENKGREGVETTASGLQYKIVKEGKGDVRPATIDTVKVHYKGTLLDGTEFDSSYKRNQPAEFQVDQVIPGWTEAMQLMNVGSTYELYLPPELAYGDRGAPPVIEPGSMLIFEVELLDVTKGEEEKKDKE